MQMQYWAMDSFRLHETLPPLLDFIKRLSKAGQVTAKALYGCDGWVAHGYVDGFLHAGMNGGSHWALCVSW
jgi:alpha-L-fucosidase 2